METFVFTVRLQQLCGSALVLRLQTHNPRKRTAAECVLSLRQLSSQETEHWLNLNPPSKSSVSVYLCVLRHFLVFSSWCPVSITLSVKICKNQSKILQQCRVVFWAKSP